MSNKILLDTKVKLYINEVIMNTLLDPDFELQLKPNIQKKLEKIRQGKIKTTSLDIIKKNIYN
ncbi:MAG: hypothetical protein AAB371_02165 [Patescibacteria group bacterium]